MKKLTHFFRTWIKSLTEPSYYNHVVRAKFSFSLKYFFFFYLLMSVVLALLFQIRTAPLIRNVSTQIIHNLTTQYPPGLEISFEPGRMNLTGVEEPFHVPFPQELEDLALTPEFPYLFTFDTTTSTADPDTFVTFTQSEIIIRQVDGSKQSYPLTDITQSFTIEKNGIGMFTSLAQTYIDRALRYLPFILALIMATVLPLVNLVVLAIYSLFTLTVSLIWGKKLNYKKSFQIGLHTITFAETVRFLQDQLFTGIDISFFFSIAFFGATIIALYSLKPLNVPRNS